MKQKELTETFMMISNLKKKKKNYLGLYKNISSVLVVNQLVDRFQAIWISSSNN